MNIQQMKYAIEVEKAGSISQAAENLYMGQPNLSKAIKELESSLGIQIFKRTPKGVSTTNNGEEFLQQARRIVSEIEDMERHYCPANPEKQGFRISVPRSSYISSAFASFMGEMVDKKKPMPVVFSETNSMHAIRNILDEGYRLGIIRYNLACESYFQQLLADQGLQHREIWEFDSLVLMSVHHPAAMSKTLRTSDLKSSVELVHGDCGVHTQNHCETLHADQRASQRRICIYERGSQFDLLTHIPSAYMWVSPMPEEVLKRNCLLQRKCVDASHRCKDVLIYPSGHSFSDFENLFLKRLEESKKMISRLTFHPQILKEEDHVLC